MTRSEVKLPQEPEGNGDVRSLPPMYRFAWLVMTRFGLATLLVIGTFGAGVYWLYYVSKPESEARLALLKQTALCLDRIVSYEEKQTEWQLEWKAYISDQHRLRQAEAAAILKHQDDANRFFERTDTIHTEQLQLLKELIQEMRELLKQQGRDVSGCYTPEEAEAWRRKLQVPEIQTKPQGRGVMGAGK